MRFFLGRAVTAQNSIKLFFDSQATQNFNRKTMHFITHHNSLFSREMFQRLEHVGIEYGRIKQMTFVSFEKDPHDFEKMLGALLRERMFKEIFDSSPHFRVNDGV